MVVLYPQKKPNMLTFTLGTLVVAHSSNHSSLGASLTRFYNLMEQQFI